MMLSSLSLAYDEALSLLTNKKHVARCTPVVQLSEKKENGRTHASILESLSLF
jgi:carbon monoxide dehydrogenase subunit G